MNWIKDNVIGLLGILLIMGSSIVTLYVKAEVNSKSIVQLRETVISLNEGQTRLNTALQANASRTTQVEFQLINSAKATDRLIESLDKLDVLYGSLKVSGAIQGEKLKQLVDRIDSKSNK